MVGAMLTTILFNLLTGRGMLPGGASVFVQFLLGAYIGTMLHREDIKKLKKAMGPGVAPAAGHDGLCHFHGSVFFQNCGL